MAGNEQASRMTRTRSTDSTGGLRPARRKRRFTAAGGLLAEQIRLAGEKRGFAVARLLTRWAEIVGPELAAMARPVRIGYRRQGLGATLTLLVDGAAAPMVQMQLPLIRERVNACYGYNAIARIVLTQSAAEGLAETPAAWQPEPQNRAPDPAARARAREAACEVQDAGLRRALEALGENVLSRTRNRKDEADG